MIIINKILSIIFLMPIVGAVSLICLPLAADIKENNTVSWKVLLWTSICTFFMLLYVFYSVYDAVEIINVFGFNFKVDSISACMMILSSFLCLSNAIMMKFLKHHPRYKMLTIIIMLFESCILMIFSTQNIVLFASLCLIIAFLMFLIIGTINNNKALATKYFLPLSIGAFLMLLSFSYTAEIYGCYDVDILVKSVFSHEQEFVIFIPAFLGLMCFTNIIPMSLCVKDIYAKVPYAIVVLLVAVSNIGLYGYMKILIPICNDTVNLAKHYMLCFFALSIFYAIKNLKDSKSVNDIILNLLIGYSAIIAIGFLTQEVNAFAGSVLNIISCSISISSVFVLLSLVEHVMGASIDKMEKWPTSIGFSLALIPAMSIVSMPIFPCFFGNFFIVYDVINISLFLAVLICVLIAFAFYVLMRFMQYKYLSFQSSTLLQKNVQLSSYGRVCILFVLCSFLSLCCYQYFIISSVVSRFGANACTSY